MAFGKGLRICTKNHGEILKNKGSYLDIGKKSSYNIPVMEGVVNIKKYVNDEYEKREDDIMEAKKNILTYEGLKKYEEELQELRVVKRREVAEKIKEAREQGDLSENAEYDAAKDEQRDIEARIEELEKILKNVEVVDEDEVDLEKINIGCMVKILDIEYDEELEYKIVGSTEANSLKGKISNESPLGKVLIGAKVGDVLTVEAQAGAIQYKVLEIQRSH